MNFDLWMLVGTVLIGPVLSVVYLIGRWQAPGGRTWSLGNRDTALQTAPWVGRAVRAHLNHTENLVPFAALVLVAVVSGHANGATALGAALFFGSRIAHALLYTAGIVYVRTLAFFVGAAGQVLILIQLF